MRRKPSVISLLLIFLLLVPVFAQDLWKVVKITDGDTVWVKREGQRKIKIREF